MEACARADARWRDRRRRQRWADRAFMYVCGVVTLTRVCHVLCTVVGSQLHVQGGWGWPVKRLRDIKQCFPIVVELILAAATRGLN